MGSNDDKLVYLLGECVIGEPTISLYNFIGKLRVSGKTYPLSIDNFLLKGSVLKNTEWVAGLVVYSGNETKIMLNSQKRKTK